MADMVSFRPDERTGPALERLCAQYPNRTEAIAAAILALDDQERRFEAMRENVAAYEAEHGVITDDEMAEFDSWIR